MDIRNYMKIEGEKPLDRIVDDGGYTSIFRTIACIGDSLSSGEFESSDKDNPNARGFHDMYDYSWGQYIARAAGVKVYNFSCGGMTAKWYWESFAEANGYWDKDKLCQAYIIALGVNDILNAGQEIGTTDDICLEDYNKNAETFAGYYARIIQRIKSMQPQARFFLVTMPRGNEEEPNPKIVRHAELLNELADLFDYTYVINLLEYGPTYDDEFVQNFYLAGHLNPMGYQLTAKMIMSYIDYIIRQDMPAFKQVPFIGTDLRFWGDRF